MKLSIDKKMKSAENWFFFVFYPHPGTVVSNLYILKAELKNGRKESIK